MARTEDRPPCPDCGGTGNAAGEDWLGGPRHCGRCGGLGRDPEPWWAMIRRWAAILAG